MSRESPDQVRLLGMKIHAFDTPGLLNHIFSQLAQEQGGWIVTANLDILRRFRLNAEARRLYGAADFRVADGMPLVWAASVLGQPLPERIAGSSFTLDIAERAAQEGRSLYLLGGDEGAAEGCKAELESRFDGIQILGASSPWVKSPATHQDIDDIVSAITESGRDPDILLVGFGSPKQEYVIERLRKRYPRCWMMGVGITFGFLAGQVERAPTWMQKSGVEWVHRMVQDPGRLIRRYLIDDLPFAALLFGEAAVRRVLQK